MSRSNLFIGDKQLMTPCGITVWENIYQSKTQNT